MKYSFTIDEEESVEVNEVNLVVCCCHCKSIVATLLALAVVCLVVLEWS